MKETIIKNSVFKLFWFLVGGIIGTITLLWLLLPYGYTGVRVPFYYPLFGDLGIRFIEVAGIILCGSGTVIAFKLLIKPKPVLVLNEKGFNYEGGGLISWERVLNISIEKWSKEIDVIGFPMMLKREYITVVIFNTDVIVDDFPSSESQRVRRIPNDIIEINLDSARAKPGKVLEIMQEYLEHYRTSKETGN